MQRAWMEKGVKNARRKQRDNDKIGRKFRTEQTEKQAAKARQTERLIERLDAVDEPRKEWQLQFSIAAAPRSGDVVAVARDATVQRGDFVLGPVDLQLDLRDRVAVTGPNGAGKSTLLALLLGRTPPTVGPGRASAPACVVGEVDQARAAFEGDEPLVDAFSREVPDWPTAEVRTLLAKFGLGVRPRGPPGVVALAGRAHPRRAGAAAGARASTCSCSTSRPTTSTCRPSSSSRRRSTPSTAPSCS